MDNLVYLDREFISYLYEQDTGATPEAVFTRTEGLNAGVMIPLFNAKASSVESKSYSLSSYQMLDELGSKLSSYPTFEQTEFSYEQASVVCWVEGMLSASSLKVTRTSSAITLFGKPKEREGPTKQILSEEEYWKLSEKDGAQFALVTCNEYFSSGVEQFPGLVGSVIDHLAFPVRALIRVYSAKSTFEEWIAVPLVIVEIGANKLLQGTPQKARRP